MKINYQTLEKKIKINFKDKDLLVRSLTHKSYNKEINNEKLEFLGDRVLGLVIAKLLPSEKIVSCCTFNDGENIFLISKQGKIFCINSNEIYCSNEYSLGYLNEKTNLKTITSSK